MINLIATLVITVPIVILLSYMMIEGHIRNIKYINGAKLYLEQTLTPMFYNIKTAEDCLNFHKELLRFATDYRPLISTNTSISDEYINLSHRMAMKYLYLKNQNK